MSDQINARSQRVRVVAAASIGNALEWYDYVVYGFFAVIMAKLFFPAGDPTVSLLITFATFGVTFLVRPIGAVVIGSYADRYGRKAAFTLTIVLMTVGTGIIAFAPTYSSIGIAAPLLILTARIIQGFSAGGEFGSATALLAEQSPNQRGYFASWQFASQGLTLVLATGVGVVLLGSLSTSQMESWGWRLPYLFGLVIGPVAYYVRRHVEETAEFQATKASRSPLREALTDGRLRLLISFGAVILSTVGMYTILFMPSYATRQLGLPGSGAFLAGFLTGIIQVIFIPLVGALSDRVGRVPICATAAAAMLVLSYPMFAWLAASPTFSTLLIVQAIIGFLLAIYMGGLAAVMAELFPTRMRTTGLSISYSFGVALFGGFAPFINAWLISATGDKLAPSFYLMLAAFISLVAMRGARSVGIR